MHIDRVDDLKAYQAAQALSWHLGLLAGQPVFQAERALGARLVRVGRACAEQLAEGFQERQQGSHAEAIGRAILSARALQGLLATALDRGALGPEEFRRLFDEALRVQQLARGFLLCGGSARRIP